jgi:imidazolonepropionase
MNATEKRPAVLLTGCAELLTLRGAVPRRGRALGEIEIIRDGALLIRAGRIAAIGPRRAIERLGDARRARKIDLGERTVLPGFVDSHTHLIFPGSHVAERDRLLRGETYEQIARTGGGIRSTVKALRRASPAELKQRALRFLGEFAAGGTTTIEAKSGYGLDFKNELKILELLRDLNQEQPLDIIPTFMGAHVVPAEFRSRPEAYIDLLVKKWIPAIASRNLAEFCDVFCDRGAFTVAQARRVLQAGLASGLTPRIHAEQLAATGAARLAVELRAASADHLDHVTGQDIRALAKSNVVCTLLPGCSCHLGLAHHAPARRLIDAGATVALATDFNPGTSPTTSMPLILSLSCSQMHMTPAEAIAAATINPTYGLGLHDHLGSLEVGKYADIAAFDVTDYREIPYYFGVNLCCFAMKRGEVIHSTL